MNRRSFIQSTTLAGAALLTTRVATANEPKPGPSKRRVKNVNTTDIAEAIRLGCGTMGRVFDENDHDRPFFASWVGPDIGLAFNPDHSEAHVPGRHLNALLHAEAVLSMKIPDDVIEKHTRAAFFSYSGALPLPLNRKELGGKPSRFLPHNVREGFHALYALTQYRQSNQARRLAEQSIQTILELWHPESGWKRAALEQKEIQLVEWAGAFISGIARALGPLVKFYRATQHGPALELAILLKKKALLECFLPDGSYDVARFGGHTHSTTCVMSSLAQLAELTGDANLMDRVRRFYDNGLKAISNEIGWSIENNNPGALPDRGEANNTGDILETALILGHWGYPEYFHHAERILRCHLLPCQLRDISWIQEPARADGKMRMADRHLGAFGFPAPYGHWPLENTGPHISFNMDIVGGAVDSLSHAYAQAVTSTQAGHRVNLLFDRETAALKVESPYPGGNLRVTMRKPGPLFARVPSWVARDALKLSIAGKKIEPVWNNGYCFIATPPLNTPIEFAFPLSQSEIVLKHRTRSIRVRLKGDSVLAMENFGADLTFFDPI